MRVWEGWGRGVHQTGGMELKEKRKEKSPGGLVWCGFVGVPGLLGWGA